MDHSRAANLAAPADQPSRALLRFGHQSECEWCGRLTDSHRLVGAGELSAFEARICPACAAEEEAAQESAREFAWRSTSFDEFRF